MTLRISAVRTFALSLIFGFSSVGATYAANPLISAIRPEGTDFEEIIHTGLKLYNLKIAKLHATSSSSSTSDIAISHAAPLNDLDFSKLEAWSDYNEIVQAFELGRDERFMDWKVDTTDFLRRPTWLYPDDGCYARADVFRDHIKTSGFTGKVYKLFVFGNLKVRTSNHPSGFVSWWYHVVPLVYDGVEAYVIDPAIDPSGPMLVDDWAKSVDENNDAKIRFSLCQGESVSPYDACVKTSGDNAKYSYIDQKGFFNAEWNRLIALKRNPIKELGDLPPWHINEVEDLIIDIDNATINTPPTEPENQQGI